MNSVPQRVLVTGATGFIGNALARRLVAQGHSVCAIVRTERAETQVARSLSDAGVEIVAGDMCDKPVAQKALRGCAHVYHLAAQKSKPGTTSAQYFAVNVRSTRQLGEAAHAAGVQRLVYASTLGVHGFVLHGTIDERSLIQPNSEYRLTKWQGESALRELHRQQELPVVIARISSVVGAGARWWLPLVRGIANEHIRLIGNGVNHVDLVSIEDIVDGLLLCANTAGVEGRTYILGSALPTTMRAFANAIADALGAPHPRNGPPAAPYRTAMRLLALLFRSTGIHFSGTHNREVLVANKIAGSARAHAELGYSPSRSVDDAVAAMVAQFAANGDLRVRHS